MRFLAVDLGASSGRTIVGTIEGGKIALEETYRFENGMKEHEGHRRWMLPELLVQIKTGIARSGDVDGIGIDTWGVDYGLIDENGDLIELPFAYRDPRHEDGVADVFGRISRADYYARVGIQEMPFNTIFQIVSERLKRPELLAGAARMLLMPELITFLLTGETVSEYSIASTTGLLDARARDWDRDLIETLELPAHLFAPVQMPGFQAGTYEGTPVYVPAMHDTGSAVAAVPAAEPGDWAYLSSGTWSLIGAELDEPVLSENAFEANFTNEGGVGGRIRFLKNVNGLWLIQECRRIWAEQGNAMSFAEIAAAAEDSAFEALIDPNDPRFIAPEDMPAEIRADLRERGLPEPRADGDVARCCYLSLARAMREKIDLLRLITGKRVSRLHLVGGGSQAELLNRLIARALDIPLHVGPVEATALGNICVQALANGLFKSQQEIRRAIADSFPVQVYEPGA
jgi:sugar (pentulose or hexulose) kinase